MGVTIKPLWVFGTLILCVNIGPTFMFFLIVIIYNRVGNIILVPKVLIRSI